MPDAAEVAIQSALINHLVAMTVSPAIPVSLPNVEFTPPPKAPNVYWLRGTVLPANSFALGVSYTSTNQHYGIFQVDVFYAQGDGELAALRVAASVIAWFKRGTVVTKDGFSVEVTDAPYRSRASKDDPWIMVAISVPYLAFASNPA